MKDKINPSRVGICYYAIEEDTRVMVAKSMKDFPFPKLESIRGELEKRVNKSRNTDNKNKETAISWGL